MTKFRDVIDKTYSTLLQSFELDNLLAEDEFTFYDFMSGFVENACSSFQSGCMKSLSYHTYEIIDDDGNPHTEYEFDSELSNQEIYILALFVAIGFYKREIDNVTAYRTHLNNKDYRDYSNAQNLAKRQERYNSLSEEVSHEINLYQLSKINSNGLSYFGGN